MRVLVADSDGMLPLPPVLNQALLAGHPATRLGTPGLMFHVEH